jgi:molybdate transport system substrate-binding protein
MKNNGTKSLQGLNFGLLALNNMRSIVHNGASATGGTLLIMIGVLTMLIVGMLSSTSIAAELRLFAAAGVRQPVERLVDDFQKKTGHTVVIDFDGSGRLVAKIKLTGMGDVFMPGGLMYVQQLEKEGKIISWKPVVAYTPVIAVNKAKLADITSLPDLARPGIKLALGDPAAMAYGTIAAAILERAGIKAAVTKNVIVYGATVKQLALYVAQGEVDAAIIGRADAFQFKDRVAMVDIPEIYYDAEIAPAAVLKSSTNIEAATALQDFLASPEALAVFEEFGFLPPSKKQ